MSPIVFIVGILVVAIFTLASYVDIKRHERHDRVLFRFCQIRRDLMAELRARYQSLSREEFESMEFLLSLLDEVIQHYGRHKTAMFNFRKMRRAVERDLEHYRKTEREARLTRVPPGRITELYADFVRATAMAFVAYTPFLRTEIILRLWRADLAKQIAQIRCDAAELPAR